MREIGARELKQKLSETLRAVEHGELVRVTLRGRPLADIVPTGAPASDDRLRQLIVNGRVVPAAQNRPARAPRLAESTRLPSELVLAERNLERLFCTWTPARWSSATWPNPAATSCAPRGTPPMAGTSAASGMSRHSGPVGLAAGHSATPTMREEWASFAVVEVDQDLVERAAQLALADDLRSLDALHLAAALLLPAEQPVIATWDRRQFAAARSHRVNVLPESRP